MKQAVIADGMCFLDHNGREEGNLIQMGPIIAASDSRAFEKSVSELIEFPWRRISQARPAIGLGNMRSELNDIEYSVPALGALTYTFGYQRTLRNYFAMYGFKNRFIT